MGQGQVGGITGKIAKLQTKILFQINLRDFDPDDPISIMAYLYSYMTSCDTLGVHENVALCTFKVFLQDPAKRN